MTVPDVGDQRGSCTDVIKVFVTSQPTSFESLELPGINELVPTKSAENRTNFAVSNESEAWVQ